MIILFNRKQLTTYWIGYLLFMICFFYYNSKDRYNESVIVKGIVVEKYYDRGRTAKSPGHYYPLYKFQYLDTFFYGSDERIFFSNKSIGDSVKIIYVKKYPEISQLYSFVTYWVDFEKLFYSIIVSYFVLFLPGFFAEFYNDFFKKAK